MICGFAARLDKENDATIAPRVDTLTSLLASNMGVWDDPERLNRRRMAMGLFQSKEKKQAKGTSCAGLRSQSLRRSS